VKRNSFIGLTILVAVLAFGVVFGVIALFNAGFTSPENAALLFVLGLVLGAIAFLAGFKDAIELFTLPLRLRKESSRSKEKAADDQVISRESAPSSSEPSSRVLLLRQDKESVMLEYRVAVLEGIINWMLYHGKFSKNIETAEMEEIHKQALDLVRRRYPEAQISFEGKWQR